LRFVEHCLKNNFTVCKPVAENTIGFDYVVDFNDGNGFKKVQVKKIYNNERDGVVYRQFPNYDGNNKTYTAGTYDYLAAVDLELNEIFLFPFDALDGRPLPSMRADGMVKNKTRRHVDWYIYRVQ
jgi:hypothetical protein